MVRVRDVRHEPRASDQFDHLPRDVWDAVYDEIGRFRDQELGEGEHVELLLVEGHAVRVNFFVDVDGTLWIERLGARPPA